MQLKIILASATACLALAPLTKAQTLDWGSEVFSSLADSNGATLDDTFVFELGAFDNGFVPDESNVGSWLENWRVFDQASYNQGIGYFTSTANMLDDGTSDSPFQSPAAPSFEGLSAYIWVRDGDAPVEGAEWLLTRADSWVFPAAVPGCCDNETPVQWSVSDLDGGDVPVWGSQNGVVGAGVQAATGPYTLQTHTFVPEPGSAMLAAFGLSSLCLRRRRA